MHSFVIAEFRIFGLFGELDHKISLKEGGITFIHGPNGCGKTTVLRLIAAVFGGDAVALSEIDFAIFECESSDGRVFFIEKIPLDKEFPNLGGGLDINRPVLPLQFGYRGSNDPPTRVFQEDDEVRIPYSEVEDVFPFVTRIGAREWMDRRTGERLSYPELATRFHFTRHSRVSDWLDGQINQVNLHFIKTQRLLRVEYPAIRKPRSDEGQVAEVIQLYANEIKDQISKKLAEQAAVTQSYDRTFPQRLLSLSSSDYVSEEGIREMYAETEEKVQKLVAAGLIDKQENITLPVKIEETHRRVLSLYLQDVNRKLSVFDDLQGKIQVFLEIVGPKLKSKRLSVNRTNGFLVESKSRPGETLQPSQLSSGEQHQIVLFYELIFKAEKNAFFLVDEPEISLHVDWQRRFLSDIRRVGSLGDRRFLIATHSPQIIGSNRELAVPLKEGILDD